MTHEDLQELTKKIRLKETGVPGSLRKVSPNTSPTVGANRLIKVNARGGVESNSPLAANAKRFVHRPQDHMKGGGLLDEPAMAVGQSGRSHLNSSALNDLNTRQKQAHSSLNVSPVARKEPTAHAASRDNVLNGSVENIRSLSALANPYTNMRNSSNAPVMASQDQARLSVNASQANIQRQSTQPKRSSLGILPGLNRPIPVGLPSLAEYGSNPSTHYTDSNLIQLKMKRAYRQHEELNKAPRHKTSINKQMNDEILSPVKQPPLKLGQQDSP